MTFDYAEEYTFMFRMFAFTVRAEGNTSRELQRGYQLEGSPTVNPVL